MAGAGDYRVFVGAFPDGALGDAIQAVRLRSDARTACITAPHVTLAGTYWRSGAAVPASEAALIAALRPLSARLAPFALQLGGIHTFGDRVVYLGVAPTQALLAVRQALLEAAGMDKHGGGWTPHLTLAMRLHQRDTAQLVADLRRGEWENGRFTAPIRALQLMQRGPADPAWRAIATIPLEAQPGQTPAAAPD